MGRFGQIWLPVAAAIGELGNSQGFKLRCPEPQEADDQASLAKIQHQIRYCPSTKNRRYPPPRGNCRKTLAALAGRGQGPAALGKVQCRVFASAFYVPACKGDDSRRPCYRPTRDRQQTRSDSVRPPNVGSSWWRVHGSGVVGAVRGPAHPQKGVHRLRPVSKSVVGRGVRRFAKPSMAHRTPNFLSDCDC